MTSETVKIVGSLGMVVVVSALLWLLLKLAKGDQQRVLAAFEAFAARHAGLHALMKAHSHGNPVADLFEHSGPVIEGTLDGCEVRAQFASPPNAAHGHSATRTLFVARPPSPLPAGLLIRPRNLFDVPERLLGRGFRTGDDAFDQQFLVEAQSEREAGRLLSVDRRRVLLEAATHSPELAVTASSGVMVYVNGLHTDPARLEQGLRFATSVARALSE